MKGKITILGLEDQKLTPSDGDGGELSSAFVMSATIFVTGYIDHVYDEIGTKVYNIIDEFFASTWQKACEIAKRIFQNYY